MLSIDVSLSMLAKDLNPDRITALKDIAVKFVQKRPNDRIGVVAYAAEALQKFLSLQIIRSLLMKLKT